MTLKDYVDDVEEIISEIYSKSESDIRGYTAGGIKELNAYNSSYENLGRSMIYIGNNILYYNREDINDVLQKGYSDLEDETQIENINKWLYEHSMKRGDVSEMKERFERNRDA